MDSLLACSVTAADELERAQFLCASLVVSSGGALSSDWAPCTRPTFDHGPAAVSSLVSLAAKRLVSEFSDNSMIRESCGSLVPEGAGLGWLLLFAATLAVALSYSSRPAAKDCCTDPTLTRKESLLREYKLRNRKSRFAQCLCAMCRR